MGHHAEGGSEGVRGEARPCSSEAAEVESGVERTPDLERVGAACRGCGLALLDASGDMLSSALLLCTDEPMAGIAQTLTGNAGLLRVAQECLAGLRYVGKIALRLLCGSSWTLLSRQTARLFLTPIAILTAGCLCHTTVVGAQEYALA